MAWQQTVEQTVTGLGFDLVDLERSAGGLLRVTIDWPWQPPAENEVASERFVTVEDCEKITRQLQYLLEVEGLEYRRLEVGSPGIDRPLRREQDYQRFAGHLVDITLKTRIGVTGTEVSPSRKKFRGMLERAEGTGFCVGRCAAGASGANCEFQRPRRGGLQCLKRARTVNSKKTPGKVGE